MLVFGDAVDELTGTADAGGPPQPPTVVPLSEGFEGDDWRFTQRCAAGCPPEWHRETNDWHTGAHSYFGEDVTTPSDKSLLPLNGLVIPANATAATLTFWHHFLFEVTSPDSYFDGGVLEVSTDGGQTWTDAGSDIRSGGYNGTIADIPSGNVLAGRSGWIGGSFPEFQQVSVDLTSYRNRNLFFRLRLGTDSGNLTLAAGWWVDDFEVRYDAPLTSCARGWSAPRPYPNGVDQPAAVGFDGALYVFGGMGANGPVANAYSYSPQSDQWTPIASLPEARAGAAAVSDGTSIYIFGGELDGQVQTTLWRYDPAANSYATLAPMIEGVAYQAAAFAMRGPRPHIFSIGGTSDVARNVSTKSVEAYSIVSDEWANVIAEHPEAVGRFAAVGLGAYVYTAGGGNSAGSSAKAYRYDTQNNVWEDEQIADLPSSGVTTGALYKGIWLLQANGAAIGWDPATNRWRSFDQIPQLVFGRAAVAGDAFFLVGGVEKMLPSTTVQQYVETDCESPTPTVTPTTGEDCVGDCEGDRMVAISELVRGVGIALGAQPLAVCPSFDSNGSGAVEVNELVGAVNNALRGCA